MKNSVNRESLGYNKQVDKGNFAGRVKLTGILVISKNGGNTMSGGNKNYLQASETALAKDFA